MCLHSSAARPGRHGAPAAELGRPLPHRGQPHTTAYVGREAGAVVLHPHDQLAVRGRQVYVDVACAGVPGRVGDRLGDDPEGGHLHGRGQRFEVPLHLEPHLGALLRGHGTGGAQRAQQPQVVQHRRTQPGHQATDVVHRRACLLGRAQRQVGRAGGLPARQRGAHHVEPHHHARQLGAEAVVEVTPQPAALVLTGSEQPSVGLLEVAGQAQCVRRGSSS